MKCNGFPKALGFNPKNLCFIRKNTNHHLLSSISLVQISLIGTAFTSFLNLDKDEKAGQVNIYSKGSIEAVKFTHLLKYMEKYDI